MLKKIRRLRVLFKFSLSEIVYILGKELASRKAYEENVKGDRTNSKQ